MFEVTGFKKKKKKKDCNHNRPSNDHLTKEMPAQRNVQVIRMKA